MRKLFPLLAAALISGCSPSSDEVATMTKGALQKSISNNELFVKDGLSITTVRVVHLSGNEYTGVASISGHGKQFDVKIHITADRKTSIFDIDHSSWNDLKEEVISARYDQFTNKYSDYILERDIFKEFMPSTLDGDKKEFLEDLATVDPIEDDGRYIVGSGCKAHSCGTDEAKWAIDKASGEGSAIILTTKDGTATLHAFPYKGNFDDLPDPLIQWAKEHGADESNIGISHQPWQQSK